MELEPEEFDEDRRAGGAQRFFGAHFPRSKKERFPAFSRCSPLGKVVFAAETGIYLLS